MGLWLHRLAVAFVLAFEALACLASVILLMLLSAAPLYSDLLPVWPAPWAWAAMFISACALAVAASWVKGIFDKRLPARIGGEPRHAHISGWTFIWIVLVMSIIIALATFGQFTWRGWRRGRCICTGWRGRRWKRSGTGLIQGVI